MLMRRFMGALGGGNPYQRLLNQFASTGPGPAAIWRDWYYGARYYLSQPLGNDRFVNFHLGNNVVEGIDTAWWVMRDIKIQKLYGAYNTTVAGVSLSGAWTTSSGTSYFLGKLSYAKNAGAYYEITLPAGLTEIGVAYLSGVNIGIARVWIDGDATLATSLPTAQSLVDDGTLSNTVLVANGGLLNPTDRILNGYNATSLSKKQVLAESFSAGSHVVKIEALNYKAIAATDTYIYINALYAFGAGVYDLTHSLYYFTDIESINADALVWEISYAMRPTGTANYEWLGHQNSLKTAALPMAVVDGGAPQQLNFGDVLRGTNVSIRMQHNVRHTELGTTNVASYDITYSLNKTNGLTIAHSVTWLMDGYAYEYPCMMGVDAPPYNRCRTLGGPVVALTDNDGSIKCNSSNKAIYTWPSTGNVGCLMYIPDLNKTVLNWAHAVSGTQLGAMDANPATTHFKKFYAVRYSLSSNPISSGETWESECNYRIKWFEGGADAALGQ